MRSPDRQEEAVNAVTHGLGLAFGVVGAVVVVWAAYRGGVAWNFWACTVYALTLVATYALSTLSHAFHHPRARHVFRIGDQASIFLFIAGSYTPVALAWLREWPWWLLHAVVWGGGVAGFASKALFAHRVHHGTTSEKLYVLLGLSPVVAAWPMVAVVPPGLLLWLLAGGLCYMAGTVFFRYDQRIRYFHAAWHAWVIAGSACHYFGILLYCTGRPV